MELDEEVGRSAKEVRVVQGKEPKHFLTVFKSRFVVHFGKATDSPSPSPSSPLPLPSSKYEMFEVHGDNGEEGEGGRVTWTGGEERVRAVEVDCYAESLTSFSTFIVVGGKGMFVWCGGATSALERKFASEYVEKVRWLHFLGKFPIDYNSK